jgi:hypothetical protein
VPWAFEAVVGALGFRVTCTPCDDGLSQPFSARRWLSLLLVMQCQGGGLSLYGRVFFTIKALLAGDEFL